MGGVRCRREEELQAALKLKRKQAWSGAGTLGSRSLHEDRAQSVG